MWTTELTSPQSSDKRERVRRVRKNGGSRLERWRFAQADAGSRANGIDQVDSSLMPATFKRGLQPDMNYGLRRFQADHPLAQ